MSDDVPGYLQDQSAKKQESIEKAIARIEKEREEMNSMRRFGFFSIPYPAIINDKAYSRASEYHHQVVDRKVITEPRGIFTNPLKKGKNNDVYFAPIEPVPDAVVQREKEFRKQEQEKLMETVKNRRENKNPGVKFKPPGPQEKIGIYVHSDIDKPYVADGPIYKPIDRFKHIGEDKRSVVIEKRGIYTNPPKEGNCMVPKDYFSYCPMPKEVEDRIVQGAKDDIEKRLQMVRDSKVKKEYKKPFAPASLMKNDNFASNSETFGNGETDDQFKARLEAFREFKKKGRERYVKSLPPGCLKHDKPFQPARLKTSGRDALFNDNLYTMPKLEPVKEMTLKERLEYQEKHKKVAFTYNKLMIDTQFSPCISSFTCNLKKDFPCITFNN